MTAEPLSLRMVRQRAKRYRDAKVLRDEAVRLAYLEGQSLRTIAAAVGLSHGAVALIVGKGDVPACE